MMINLLTNQPLDVSLYEAIEHQSLFAHILPKPITFVKVEKKQKCIGFLLGWLLFVNKF